MEPKEKAKQLYDKCFDRYCTELSYDKNHSKAKCISLDMVDEIIQFGNALDIREPMMYWNSVKKEINKL
jgi:hypothetical protein